MKVGITGKNGFVGYHLSNFIYHNEDLELIDFERSFFNNNSLIDDFVSKTDIIIHLAAINRHESDDFILKTNIELTNKISSSIKRVKFEKKLIFVSSIHENSDSAYGISKYKSDEIFSKLSNEIGFNYTSLIAPNVFGPFCKPNYNSFVATFSNSIINNNKPKIIDNNNVKLIYINNLIDEIIKEFSMISNSKKIIREDKQIKVSEVLDTLLNFHSIYIEKDVIPNLSDSFHLNLFNTFRSYIDYKNFYPRQLKKNLDERGNFSEIIRTNSQGQFSFSTTNPDYVRGNHYHTRKVERFVVISGKALISLRKIGSEEIFEFELDGNNPSFVDMPIWYTHSIKNIGSTPLTTLFWINEPYNSEDPDTFFENV